MHITHSPARISIKGYKRDDCTVLAIGNALGLSYDLSRKILQVAGIKINGSLSFRKKGPRTKHEFTNQRYVESLCHNLSVSQRQFEIDDNKKRATLSEFAKEHTSGTYIVLVDRHLTVVMDGKIVDSWDSRERKLIASYEIDINEARKSIKDLAKFYRMDTSEHITHNHKYKILKTS